jgi:hypothetical protein
MFLSGPVAENNVELLAFLSAPGDLTIRQGTDVRTMTVSAAGLTSFKVIFYFQNANRFI